MMDDSVIKHIYGAIADQESRDIFAARMIYSITRDKSALTTVIDHSVNQIITDTRVIDFEEEWSLYTGNLLLFGAGRYAGFFLKFFPNIKWKGVIDSHLEEGTFQEIPLIAYDKFTFDEHIKTKIVITSKPNYYEMLDQLHESGIQDDSIIDGTFLWDVIEGKQYFDLSELPHTDAESFVDVGCLDGLSSVTFHKWSGKYSDVCYCFEPDRRNLKKTENNLKKFGVENYELFDKGVWDSSKELYFDANGTGQAHFEKYNEGDKKEGLVKLPVVSIDEALAGKNVTFIKMDIEGSELMALRGAEKTVREQKPKLAICVYHKPSDIVDIPSYVLNVRSDYKLYFRHYADTECETVMYAI